MEWNGMEWNGMEWNGMEWNGMEWNGMEWNGMECPVTQSFETRGISFEEPCIKQLLSHHLFFSLFIELLLSHSISY
jgi:hypothetical protein